MGADQCGFCQEGMCVSSEFIDGDYKCQHAVPVGDCGLLECHGDNSELMTEEEYDTLKEKDL